MAQPALFKFEAESAARDIKPVIPRYYQEEAVEATIDHLDRGVTRLLTVMSCGMGKTSVKCWQMEALHQKYGYDRFLCMVHREELIEQIEGRVSQLLPDFTVTRHGAGRKGDLGANVCVASVQAVSRSQSRFIERFGARVILTDEAHRAVARTYQEVYMRSGVYDGEAISLGVTATAHRLDKRSIFGAEATPYQAVSYSMPLRRAVSEGWLVDIVPFRQLSQVDLTKVKRKGGEYDDEALAKAVNNHGRNILAFKTWQAKAADKQTIVFCVNVAHAFAVADVFSAAGIKPGVVWGGMDSWERSLIFGAFRQGTLQVIVNVNIATEGVDVPSCECALILRPTKSWSLYIQMVGRPLRPLPGLIDHLPLQSQAEERRRIIAESAKPHALVIEVVDHDAREGDEPPTVEGIVGIPPKLVTKPKTASEIAGVIGDIPEDVLKDLIEREIDVDDLVKEAARYNIMREIKEAESVATGANFRWIKLPAENTRLYLSCGQSYEGDKRDAHIDEDALGAWTLTLTIGKGETKDYPVGTTLEEALAISEKVIVARWPEMKQIASRANEKRLEPPSERQLDLLRRFKVPEVELAKMSRGDAAIAITLKMEQKQRERAK